MSAKIVPRIHKKCGSCGKDIYVYEHKLKSSVSGNMFCSNKCVGIYSRNKKRVFTKEWRNNLSIANSGRPAHNRGKRMSEEQKKHLCGENHYNWKGGDENRRKYMREYYRRSPLKRRDNQKRQFMKKAAGELTIETIQIIYEDNIKKYSTLTCYLCLKPIPFGKDHLEHKLPISRGGTNVRDNLDVACQKCNCKKHNKTVSEFLELSVWGGGN